MNISEHCLCRAICQYPWNCAKSIAIKEILQTELEYMPFFFFAEIFLCKLQRYFCAKQIIWLLFLVLCIVLYYYLEVLSVQYTLYFCIKNWTSCLFMDMLLRIKVLLLLECRPTIKILSPSEFPVNWYSCKNNLSS